MTDVHLDTTDAMELAELLLFVRNWLARDNHVLAPSLADFIGVDGYHLPELREDLTRFAFLLGGDTPSLLGGDHEESFLSG
jgi:hypothetical protein